MRLVPNDQSGLDFYSTLSSVRLFSIKAALAGPLSKFVKRGSERSVTVSVPLNMPNGTKQTIKSVYYGPFNSLDLDVVKLVSATQGQVPPNSRSYDFLFHHDNEDYRYLIEIDNSIDVSGFKEVIDKRPVFQTVPPVAQMAAFLRAITRRKRTAINVLDNLRTVASPASLASIEAIHQAEINGAEISHEVSERAKKLLQKQGKVITEQVLVAFSLFIDMELGTLASERLLKMRSIAPSQSAIYMVINYFGGTLDENDWRGLFDEEPRPLEEVRAETSVPPYSAAIEKFSTQVNRTPVQILQQISRESNSMRVVAFAEALQRKVGGGNIAINDQQLALLASLSAAGRRYNANTVMALCLFVDVEVNYVKESDIKNKDLAVEGFDTSTYAMLAVAGAFDVNLRGFSIVDLADEEIVTALPSIVRLTEIGFLGGFRKKNESRLVWHWVRTQQAAIRALRPNSNIEFARTILGAFPVIEQLSEIDLANMAESGRDFVAAFQSDFDKTLVWRRLKDIPEDRFRSPLDASGVRRNFSYIEGFSAYYFSRIVIGKLIDTTADKLMGTSGVIMVFHDNRDNRHYKYVEHINDASDMEPPRNTGWVWKGKIVLDIDLSGMPGIIRELNQDTLLGRYEQSPREGRLLGCMYEALKIVTTGQNDYRALSSRPEFQKRLRERILSPHMRDLVNGLIDEYTFNVLQNLFEKESELVISPANAMLEDVDDDYRLDTICMCILCTVCTSGEADSLLEGFYKQIDEASFRAKLYERLSELLASEVTSDRVLALRLMASEEIASDAYTRFSVIEALRQATDDEDPSVVYVASLGLVRISLSYAVPLLHFCGVAVREIENDEEEVEEQVPQEETDLDYLIVKSVARDMEDWSGDIKQENPKRYASLPFIDGNGEVDKEKLQPFINYLAALEQASLNEDGELRRRYYAIVPKGNVKAISGLVLESWVLLAEKKKMSIREMIASSTEAELFLDHRIYAAELDNVLFHKYGMHPFLGGKETPLRVFHYKIDERITPYREVNAAVASNGRQESPFFLELFKLFFAQEGPGFTILRLTTAEGQNLSDLEADLPEFKPLKKIDLYTTDVFDREHLRFMPTMRALQFSEDQIGHTADSVADFQALMGLLGGKKLRREEVAAILGETLEDDNVVDESEEEQQASEESHEEPVIPASPDWSLDEDEESMMRDNASSAEDMEEINNLASTMRVSFALPTETERQIVNMLLLAKRHSQIELFPQSAAKEASGAGSDAN